MAIRLTKGQTIDLRKSDSGDVYDLSQLTIGLGWDVRKKSGFLSGLFGGKSDDYDLDAIAFLLDEHDKVTNLGKDYFLQGNRRIAFQESDVIFYHNLSAPNGGFRHYKDFNLNDLPKYRIEQKVKDLLQSGEFIVHTGDNLTGDGDGDDEQIIVKLSQIPERIKKILFLVSIYQGQQKNQHFGMIDNAFMRAVDAKGREIARYDLSNLPEFNGMHTMLFGEVYRKGDGWKFRALGNPVFTDNFLEVLKNYVN
jgi:tellurium resistance protein TerD